MQTADIPPAALPKPAPRGRSRTTGKNRLCSELGSEHGPAGRPRAGGQAGAGPPPGTRPRRRQHSGSTPHRAPRRWARLHPRPRTRADPRRPGASDPPERPAAGGQPPSTALGYCPRLQFRQQGNADSGPHPLLPRAQPALRDGTARPSGGPAPPRRPRARSCAPAARGPDLSPCPPPRAQDAGGRTPSGGLCLPAGHRAA